jgi:hypothetical protein
MHLAPIRRLSARTTSVPAGAVSARLADTSCMNIRDREARERTVMPLGGRVTSARAWVGAVVPP